VIPRLILLLALVFAIYYIRQKILKAPASQRRGLLWKYGLIGLAVLLLGLAVAGRVHWISALVAAALPFARQMIPLLIRYFPLLQHHYKQQQGQQGPAAGNQSAIETAILKMSMDHDSGKLAGEVISGPFSGQSLDSMNQHQLLSLLAYCQQQDMDSSKLLASYLSHRFGDDWQQNQAAASNGDISEQEALDLLGLNAGASEDDIVKAHRSLMQKVHPDRGGNDYLAAKINQAKELLLAGLRR
jgi:DnaJ-like protein